MYDQATDGISASPRRAREIAVPRARPAPDGAVNLVVAWGGFAIGALIGLTMGLWSFDGPVAVPALFGDYDDTPRRLFRLGHTAFFGVGMLNLFLARNIRTLALAPVARRIALGCMNFGNVALPLTLIGAALFLPLKYLLPLPASAVTIALCFAARGAWTAYHEQTRRLA